MNANLKVWYGPMPETNGKTNWTAVLYKDGDIYSGITIDRSEYPDRVRYEADKMRFMIGEITEEPDILEYDSKLHSGYLEPITDVERYAYLMSLVSMRKPNSGDPECPMLSMYADGWNEEPNKSAKQRIIETIDKEIMRNRKR